VYCWGLDRDHTDGRAFKVEGITDAVEVAAGMRSACARTAEGKVACWNEYTGLRWVPGIEAARSVAVGPWGACAAEPAGVRCWDALPEADKAIETSTWLGVDDPIQVAVAFYHACALERGGAVRCWGSAEHGQLGVGETGVPVFGEGSSHGDTWVGIRATPPPKPSSSSRRARQPSKKILSCVHKAGGTNSAEQLSFAIDFNAKGKATDVRRTRSTLEGHFAEAVERCAEEELYRGVRHVSPEGTPHTATFDVFIDRHEVASRRTYPVLEGATTLAARGYYSCATTNDGALQCWGFTHGFDGPGIHGTRWESERPAPVDGIDEATAVSIGWRHVCVQRGDGGHRCFGGNDGGTFGPDAPEGIDYAVHDVDLAREFTEISAGPTLGCGRRNDGTVWCWGSNDGGRLGVGAPPGGSLPPTPVAGLPRPYGVTGHSIRSSAQDEAAP
jgi:hypothetical protein